MPRADLAQPTYLVIRSFDRNAGFTALLLYALNGIRIAEEEGRLPVINLDRVFTFHFHDPDIGANAWDYFFKPPGKIRYDRFRDALKRGEIDRKQVRWLSSVEAMHHHGKAPNRIATFYNDPTCESADIFFHERRARARELVRKYLKVHAAIREEAEAIFSDLAGPEPGTLWGVHIRGTDLNYTAGIPPSDYVEAIRSRAESEGKADYRILLATDQQQFVEQFEAEFGADRVLSQNCLRGSGTIAPFKLKSSGPYQKGKEVLIDMLLLSRCDLLFKGPAAVGEAATWFCDELEVVDLSPRFRSAPSDRAFLTKTAGVVTGAVRLPWQETRASWTEFLERQVYAYAPVGKISTTMRRLFEMWRRRLAFQKAGFRFRDSRSLLANLAPRMLDFTEGPAELELPVGSFPLCELRSSDEIASPVGLFPDGWLRKRAILRLRPPQSGTLILRGSVMCPSPITVTLRWNNEDPVTVRRKPGPFALEVPIGPTSTDGELVLDSDREWQLPSPDERIVSIWLETVEFRPGPEVSDSPA